MAVYTTIDNPELYFQVKTYSGTGSENAITLDGDENMQPDLVWLKRRDSTGSHRLFDAIRGATKEIYSDANNAEGTEAQSLKSFDSDGFTMGTDAATNGSSRTYVAWCWKESADAGFDIVAYTGASGDQTFSHSLGVAPDTYIVKERGNTNSWVVNHKGLTNQTGYYLLLNTTDGEATDSWFNATAPTSSVVSANDGDSPTNRDGGTYIMYLFAGKQGFSKFGTYTGNGDNDSPFIYLGFRPAFIIVKNIDSGTPDWVCWDNKRNGRNTADNEKLYPNSTNAEANISEIDLLSNGFKLRSGGTENNTSGEKYIYMAWAEAPFVNSNGVPCNAR